MEFKFDSEVYSKIKRQRRRRAWKRVLSAMMCLVVFCTTYVLILPAITKETDVFCGIEEHIHNEKCYEKVLLCENHEHSAECYETLSELICTEPTDVLHNHTEDCVPSVGSVLICEEAESEGHTHSESCGTDLSDEAVCGQEETEGHVHGEECSTETTVFACGIEEFAGHTHGESCGTVVSDEAVCGQEETEEHSHSEECFDVTYACGTEESEGHTHGESCGTEVQSVLTCELEEIASHAHDESCFDVTYACGTEESAGHIHSESCYAENITYSCGLEENAPTHSHGETCYENVQHLICAFAEMQDHEHTEACYASELVCDKTEHSHGVACFADPNADVETAEQWEATLPILTGNYAEDVVAIARRQLGYTESENNYIVKEDNSIKGYTRYGQWYGDPYGEWDAMFASFCCRYAGIMNFPINADSALWVESLKEKELFRTISDYVPKSGDLIFFDRDQDGAADSVGVVDKLENIDITVIEGNSNDQVKRNFYDLFDKSIVGYGAVSEVKLPEAVNPETEAPVTDDPVTEESETEPPIEESNVPSFPNGSDAWAEIITSAEPAETTVEEVIEETPVARTYSLRRSSNTYAMARAGTPIDLTPYIDTVAMYDPNGNLIPSGSTVAEGDIIRFTIGYVLPGQTLGNANGTIYSDTLTYTLPSTFEIVRSESGNIRNSDGVIVGTYVIDSTTKSVTLTFDDNFVQQNAVSGLPIKGTVSFYSTVTKITEGDKEDQNYKFTDGITLGITIEEEKEAVGDLKIEKQKTEVNGEELIYQVTVTSSEGTNGPITITDTMSKGLKFVSGISVTDKNGNNVSNARFNAASDGSAYTLTLPEMAPGSSYTVTYKCQADIDLLDADMKVSNTAKVNGKDSEGFDLEDKVTVNHNFEMLKKTGVKNDDGSITWTITVNQAKADISGWILEDIIGGDQAYTGTVTIKDANGNVVAQNQRLPYTFPEGSKSTYVITYTTSHGFEDGDTIYNKAILRDKDTDITVVEGVGIGSPFTKTGEAGELIQDENGNNLLPITWTVTIDTTNGPIPAGEVIYDKMNGSYHQGDMYMTYDQVMAAIASLEAELKRVGSSVSYASAETFVEGYSAGPNYNRDKLNDAVNYPELRNSTFERFSVILGKEIPQGQILTFSYQGYGIFTNNIVVQTVFNNRISLSEVYEVEASVHYTGGTVKATKYAISYYDPETQSEQGWFWDTIDWDGREGISRYEYEKLHDDYLAWSIEVSIPPNYAGKDNIVIFEDLPDGVTVTDLFWVFQDRVPTTYLQLKDIVLGQTYTWDFTVYPGDQYGQWRPQGGQTVSITVNVTEAGDIEIIVPGIVFEAMGQYAAIHGLDESYGYLDIFTQINEDLEWTPREEGSLVYVNHFENKFTITNENGDLVDIGSQTQIITKDESEGVIRKDAEMEDNIISYSVILNAYKKDLVEFSGTLNVYDELTYKSTDSKPLRLRLVPGSVKLYEIRVMSDGSYTKLGEITASYNYSETSTVNNGETTWVHTIDLNVPDGKSLLLEYSYKATGDKDAAHEVNNTCTISGVGEGSIEGDNKVEIEIKDATAQADTQGVALYKVDAANNGVYLKDAKFNIYIWNRDQGKYIIVRHPDTGETEFTTDMNGRIVLDVSTLGDEQFAYNTAYYIVEVESPDGYYLSPENYYFYIFDENTHANPYYGPNNFPHDFQGQKLVSGDIIYRDNVSYLTEISIEKYWRDYNGNYVTVTGDQVSKITVELWQMLEGDPSSARVYGTYTITPDAKGNWSLTVTGLPKATEKADGTKDKDYLYYVREVNSGRYFMESSENNGGINSGIIKIVNREIDGYVLPETGGHGTRMYTVAGTGLIGIGTACLVYRRIKRRREGANSS